MPELADGPVMLQCGHVFLQSSVDALHTRAAVAVQCPTCNQTASKARAMKLVF